MANTNAAALQNALGQYTGNAIHSGGYVYGCTCSNCYSYGQQQVNAAIWSTTSAPAHINVSPNYQNILCNCIVFPLENGIFRVQNPGTLQNVHHTLDTMDKELAKRVAVLRMVEENKVLDGIGIKYGGCMYIYRYEDL